MIFFIEMSGVKLDCLGQMTNLCVFNKIKKIRLTWSYQAGVKGCNRLITNVYDTVCTGNRNN